MRIFACFLTILLCHHLIAFTQQQQLAAIIKDVKVSGIQLLYSKNNQVEKFNIGNDGSGIISRPITDASIFEAASLSKPVFAYAVLRLYDRGIIDIDTPLLHYTGSYVRFDSKDPRYAKITARMVLRHTTGLPNWGNDSGARLLFSPDSCFSYSGEGYLFLQKVLEEKLDKTLNEIMQEEVFTPLQMNNSSYTWNDKFSSVSTFGDSQNQRNRHRNQNAAYSLLTNTTDYHIFLQALLSGKGLKPATHSMMFQVASQANRFTGKANESDPYIDWGLGFGLQKNEKGNAIWHWGDNGKFKCFFMAFPATDEVLVYFTHSDNGLNCIAEISKLFFGEQHCWVDSWLGYGR